jgi:hypothetical protein
MTSEVFIEAVDELRTRSGKTRYVLRDGDGREYTTLRPQIGREAAAYRGGRARLEYHEEQRGDYLNVYLDRVEPASGGGSEAAQGGAGDSEPEEVAWNAAIEAAPWLLGTSEPTNEVPPDELFDKLEPFKARVAEDIKEAGRTDDGE